MKESTTATIISRWLKLAGSILVTKNCCSVEHSEKACQEKAGVMTLTNQVSLFIHQISQLFENFIDFTNLLIDLLNALLSLLNHFFIQYNLILQLKEILSANDQIQLFSGL